MQYELQDSLAGTVCTGLLMWLPVLCISVVFAGCFRVVVCGVCDRLFGRLGSLSSVVDIVEVGIAGTRREIDVRANSEVDERLLEKSLKLL